MHPDSADHQADLVVIGSGVAGLSAALAAAEAGASVLLLTAGAPLSGSSPWAQGGIAAALGPDDDPLLHAADTLAAGAGLNDTHAVDVLVQEGRQAVQALLADGVPFDGSPSHPELGLEAGHRRRRIVHANGAATGHAVTTALLARTVAQPRIRVVAHTPVDRLLTGGPRVIGAACGDVSFRGRAVVLATGGYASLFARTTNAPESRGQGLALAYAAGAGLADLEFVQFHPTALAVPGQRAFLLSEALRGEGALLVDDQGRQIVDPLLPRDRVARAVARHLRDHGPVYLTLRHLDPDFVRAHFATLAAQLAAWDIDLATDPLPIAPAAHYCMGGVRTDDAGRSDVPGLYAAGEVACTGAQGANRLASNSLLECLVFGRRAALAALQDGPLACARWNTEPLPGECTGDPTCNCPGACDLYEITQFRPQVRRRNGAMGDCGRMAAYGATAVAVTVALSGLANEDDDAGQPTRPQSVVAAMRPQSQAVRQEPLLGDQLDRDLGVERTAAGLQELLATLQGVDTGDALVARLAARSALLREESRGAHARADFPEARPAWQGRILWRRDTAPMLERIHRDA